jgi:hypothetical protein
MANIIKIIRNEGSPNTIIHVELLVEGSIYSGVLFKQGENGSNKIN